MTSRGTLPYTLVSVKPFDKALRLAAEAAGAKVICLMERNAVLVEADSAARTRLSTDRRFRKVTEFAPSGKVEPELAARVAAGAESVEVSIVSLTAADRSLVRACLESGGGEMLQGCINEGDTLRARLPAALVAELASRGDVRWMERFERPQLMNDVAVEPVAMNVRTVWNAHGLTGAGQIISTSDSGIDTGNFETMHEDLRNRVKDIKIAPKCVGNDPIGHGTHTAGSIVGDGTKSDGKIRGTAYAADLYAWFCSDGDDGINTPETMSALFTADGEWNAHIHSASWGSSLYGKYTTECVDNDTYVWQNPEFLPVYAAGNDGRRGRQTIASPASAKNVLTVGATQNARTGYDDGWGNGNPRLTVSFSSRGPCQDGRIKPDIAAPGSGVLSTRAHGIDYSYGIYDEFYAYDSGTSMACPLTAGAVALVRQWLVERKGFEDVAGKRPTAALMKAVITGGAKNAAIPNHDQGWGRVDLEETLFPSGRDVKLVDRIPFAADHVFEYLIETTNAAPLDVQLCWIDYPGGAGGSQTSPRLVNDLDLTVEALDGSDGVLLGNGGKVADVLNNMESVRIATAAPGKYLITVNCKTILYDYEDGGAAALYVRGAFDPEAQPSGLDRVRIRRMPDVTYRTLDAALADVRDGDTVEILESVPLREALTLKNSVTICATNATDPEASAVKAGGTLTLDGQVRVLFTNVVFRGASPDLRVVGGSTVALAGAVGMDRIVLEGDGKVELAGALNKAYAYRVTPAKGHVREGEVFGRASVDLETARQYANLFVNTVASELVGEACDDGKGGVALRWTVGDVPESAAVARLAQGGKTVRFADMDVLLKYVKPDADAEIAVLTNCQFEGVLKTGAHKLSIRSEKGATLTPKGEDETFETSAAFVAEAGGTLSLSNVVLKGFSQFGDEYALVVVESGGRFLMQSGTELRDIYNAGSYGAVLVKGNMVMANGSRIVGCAGGYGAGVCLEKGGVLDLRGAEISGCQATEHGGGIYVSRGSTLNLSGEARIVDSFQRDEYAAETEAVNDDVYVCDNVAGATLPLNVSDMSPKARVGVLPSSSANRVTDAVKGTAFANLKGKMSEATAAAVFYNDAHNDYYTGLIGSVSRDKLVWNAKDIAPGSVPEEEAAVRVVIGGATNFYPQLSVAFASVKEGKEAVLTLLKKTPLDADVNVLGHVRLDGRGYGICQAKPDNTERQVNRLFTVSGPNNSLCLTNVLVSGHGQDVENYYAYGTLFKVAEGGSLTLEKGAVISRVVESDETYWPSTYSLRSTPAIDVSAGGQLTMKSGSKVVGCTNYPDNENDVVGGGITVTGDGSVFRMEGGVVTSCNASRGGGVAVENGAALLVSGDATIAGNLNYGQADDDLYFNDARGVVLTDVFTGRIGHTLGATKADSETNVFGEVSSDCPVAWTNLAYCAANFHKDADPAVTGCIVTNATEALLVWSSAVTDKGVFTDVAGKAYGLVKGVPPPKPIVTNAVPKAVSGLVYSGQAQTGVVESVGFLLTGNVATNAGTYTATAILTNGVWTGGSTAPTNIAWSIAKATYDMRGVTFTNETYEYDGTVRSLAVVGNLPAGVSVSYEGNGKSEIGVHTVTAKFTGDALNYEPIPDMTATLTIFEKPEPPEPPEPPVTDVTNFPTPIAFQSIERLSETRWRLVVTNRVPGCWYWLVRSEDLTKPFVTTDAYEQAGGDAPAAWTNEINTTGGLFYWRAGATWGTMPKDE